MKSTSMDPKIGVVGGKTFQWNEKNPAFNKKNDSFAFQKIDPYLGYARTMINIGDSGYADSFLVVPLLIKKRDN